MSVAAGGAVRSLIPARIDRLPWSPFHTRMVAALGVAWILDGLEISIASAVGDTLTHPDTLGLSSTQVGLLATVYLVGEVVGALVFGALSDRLGRRNLFTITLAVYFIGSGLTALTLGNSVGWLVFLYATRFIAGMGIGGEYAAVNSAIDELIPAKFRGRIDIMVNGTYWFGALLANIGTFVLLNQLEPSIAWRIGFAIGPILGIVIIFVRRHLPESPRWQVMHGRTDEAEKSIAFMEHEVQEKTGRELPPVDESKAIDVKAGEDHGYLTLLRVLFREYPTRSILGATMMITQSFLYNAIFFTATLVLGKFYGVASENTPLYLIAFAVGNLVGPLALGHFFDTGDQCLPLLRRCAQRDHPDHRLVRDLLLRLRRGELGVPDGERDLPDGGPGQGDRGVLRHRAVLRGDRSGDLRRADRRRQRPVEAVLRLPHGRRDHDRRRDRGADLRRQCGGAVAGGRRHAVERRPEGQHAGGGCGLAARPLTALCRESHVQGGRRPERGFHDNG
jgi:MFS family permease